MANESFLDLFGVHKWDYIHNLNVRMFVGDPLFREHHDFFIASYLHTGISALVGRRRPNILARTISGNREFYINLLVSHCRDKNNVLFPIRKPDGSYDLLGL